MADTFTFSTGITVQLRRVSPYLVTEIDRVFPEPDPPTQEVELDGEKKIEPNPADPAYLRLLVAHRRKISERKLNYVLKHGVTADESEMRAAVDEKRRAWQDEFGVDLEEKDTLLAYLKYVCVGSPDELTELVNAIQSRSKPTEGGIAAEAKSFQGPISGA